MTKYINVNIETSLFSSSRGIIGKYVMLCNLTGNELSKLGVFDSLAYNERRKYLQLI